MKKPETSKQHFLFGQIIVRLGFATAGDVTSAFAAKPQSGERLGELLIRRGHLTHYQLTFSLGMQRLLRALPLVALFIGPAALADPLNNNPDPLDHTTLVLSADRPAINDRQPIAIPVKSLVRMLGHGLTALKPDQRHLHYEVDAYDTGGLVLRLQYRF